MKIRLILLLAGLTLFTSCKFFDSTRLFRFKPGYPYAQYPENPVNEEYRIAPFDKLNMILFSNDGEKLVNVFGEVNNQNRQVTFDVEYDGTVRVPLVGRVYVKGMTTREVEELLEKKYSEFYVDPFVYIDVTNMRVLVFRGGNTAQVVTLYRPNTTLLEIIAMTGGTSNVKTHRIKLVRGDLRNPEVFLIDLSTVEGMKQGDIVVQANDIIYLQPRDKVAEKVVTGIAPYTALVSTLFLLYYTFIK